MGRVMVSSDVGRNPIDFDEGLCLSETGEKVGIQRHERSVSTILSRVVCGE